jgi:phospholipid/cholesterol/gamma-HCH transport system substrate-binding protein
MPILTQRRQNMISGAIALLLLVSATSIGVKSAFGAYDGGFVVTGSFDAAGQGLLPGSDVKVYGVNVGAVKHFELHEGRARIQLRLKDGEQIPKDAVARIRAKTLFGEKYVDLDIRGLDERKGPFFRAGDTIEHTEGGFELEAVLADLYPLLDPKQGGIDGTELLTVIHNLAEGGRGLGDEVNRTLVNGAKVSGVFADNNDKTAQFLHDFAAVSDQLADSADDLVGLADAGNAVLPVLNTHEAELVKILQQTGRLSNDVADLLLGNKPFVDAALGDGSKAVQVLYSNRTLVVPLVIGLRQYVQTLTEAIRIKVGDGTLMGAVKGILGNQLCAVVSCTLPGNTQAAVAATPPPAAPTPTATAPAGGSTDGGLGGLIRRVLGA